MINKVSKLFDNVRQDCNLQSVPLAFKEDAKTKVVVFCYVYNHEKYIAQCLDSMLSQLVDFNVEIIIHDDNSTDSSLEIIKEYQNKYPYIIKVISQQNNLYDKSHGLLPIFKFLRKYHDGEYISICEGDDYWKDPYKLAFQSKVMDLDKSLSFCVHKVDVMNDETKEITRTIPAKKFNLKTGIIDSQKFISLTSVRYPFQTSSYFFRTIDFSYYLDNLPHFAEIMPTEDESLLLYFGQLGNVCYLDKSLSTYRKFSNGSWSNEHKDPNKANQGNERLLKMIDAVEEFDKYTNYKFHKQCEQRVTKHQFRVLMNDGNIDEIFKVKKYRDYFRKTYPKEYFLTLFRRIFKRNR